MRVNIGNKVVNVDLTEFNGRSPQHKGLFGDRLRIELASAAGVNKHTVRPGDRIDMQIDGGFMLDMRNTNAKSSSEPQKLVAFLLTGGGVIVSDDAAIVAEFTEYAKDVAELAELSGVPFVANSEKLKSGQDQLIIKGPVTILRDADDGEFIVDWHDGDGTNLNDGTSTDPDPEVQRMEGEGGKPLPEEDHGGDDSEVTDTFR